MYRHAQITVAILSLLAILCGVANAQTVNSPIFDDESGTFPVTASITRVDFVPAGMNVEFTTKNTWPNVVPEGWGGPIQYSVGLAISVNGTYYAAAPIEFWHERGPDGTGPLTELNEPVCEVGTGQITCNWFYSSRWGAHLVGAHPVPGDRIGVYVVSGSVRNKAYKVKERSNVVDVILPGAANLPVSYEFGTVPVPPVEPPPVTPIPPVDPPANESLAMRVERLDQEVGVLVIAVDQLRKMALSFEVMINGVAAQAATAETATRRIDEYLSRHPVPTTCKASFFGFGSCTLFTEP